MNNSFDTYKNKAVIISGFPKSGTTLFTALLDYHPELVVYPEEFKYVKRIVIQGHTSLEEGRIAALEMANQIVLGQSGGAAAEVKRNYSDLDTAFFKRRVEELTKKAQSHKEILLAYIEAYHDTLMRSSRFLKEAKKAWAIKRPSEYYLFHKYKEWFRNNTLIWFHIVRDPYDNYTSIHRSRSMNRSLVWTPRHFAPDWLLSKLFERKLTKELKHFYRIQYEDLVTDPETVMRKVAAIIGIRYDNSLLVPTLNGYPWRGNSAHGTVFTSVNKSSVGTAVSRLNTHTYEHVQRELKSARNKLAARKRYLSMLWHRHFPGKRQKFY